MSKPASQSPSETEGEVDEALSSMLEPTEGVTKT
jgi:hypothetical protein